MLSREHEKILLQLAVILACVVPIIAGFGGMLRGVALVGGSGDVNLDSHMRYLSGLLLAIGLGFLSTVRRITHHTQRFRILTAIVVTGGVGRLLGMVMVGVPNGPMCAALVMELGVAPLLCAWQNRIARRQKHHG